MTLIYMHRLVEKNNLNVTSENVVKLFITSFHMAQKNTYRSERIRNKFLCEVYRISTLELFHLEQFFLKSEIKFHVDQKEIDAVNYMILESGLGFI